MSNPLFRESALQSLTSPEQLDQLMQITRPRAWIALSAISVILAVAILWSIFGSLPTSVVGQGLVIKTGGVFDVVSYGNGTITGFTDRLHLGDKIRKGQMIATISQPALEIQVMAAKADLARLEAERKDILSQLNAEKPAQRRAFTLQEDVQQKIILAKQDQLRSLRTVEQQQAELLRDGLITRQRYEETRQAIFAAENEIGNARNMLQRLTLDQLAVSGKHDESQRNIDSRIAQASNRLNDLQVQLELASSVVARVDGIVVEVMAMLGDTVKVGQPIMSLETEERTLSAVIYLPPLGNAKLIKTGMPAQISPVTAKKERYGYMLGKVTGVAKYPATENGMMSIFNNQALVRELSKTGPPIAVEVELIPDPATKSGYKWSSNAGAVVELNSGTSCLATFVVEKKRPISLIIPLLKETLGL